MTRQHASQYQVPEDPYAADRCGCGHIVYANQKPGDACLFAAEGCTCTNHRLREVAGDGASDA